MNPSPGRVQSRLPAPARRQHLLRGAHVSSATRDVAQGHGLLSPTPGTSLEESHQFPVPIPEGLQVGVTPL